MRLAISSTIVFTLLTASTSTKVLITKNDLDHCLRDCEERFGRDEYGIGSAADHCRSICYTSNRHRKSSLTSSQPTRRPTSGSSTRRRPENRLLTPTYYPTPSTRHHKSSQEGNAMRPRPTGVKNKETIAEALKRVATGKDEVSCIVSYWNLVLRMLSLACISLIDLPLLPF